jgi:hypothetical protein
VKCSVVYTELVWGLSYPKCLWRTNKKFWEGLIAYFLLIRHIPQRKRRPQQFFFVSCISCRGNVYTELLPSNSTGIDTKTDMRDL